MRALLVFVGLTAAMGCGTRYIQGTRIKDTRENREIADLVERYRLAVEHRDIDALREMVSRRYYENAGTTADNKDDYGYDVLEQKVLPMLRDDVKSVQFDIMLRNIEFKGDRAYAEFEYYYKYFYVEGGKDRWVAKNDFARLEFAREDGVWRIVGGM